MGKYELCVKSLMIHKLWIHRYKKRSRKKQNSCFFHSAGWLGGKCCSFTFAKWKIHPKKYVLSLSTLRNRMTNQKKKIYFHLLHRCVFRGKFVILYRFAGHKWNHMQELIYHAAAAVLLLIASIILLVSVNDSYYRYAFKPFLTASVSDTILLPLQFTIQIRRNTNPRKYIFLYCRLSALLMPFCMLSVHSLPNVHTKAFEEAIS